MRPKYQKANVSSIEKEAKDLNRQGLGEEGQMASWHMKMARPYSQEGKFELEISDFDDQIIEDPKI